MHPRGGRSLAAAAAVALCLLALAGTADAERDGPRRNPYDGYAQATVYVVPYRLYVGGGLVAMRILDQSGGEKLLDDRGAGLTLYTGLRLSHRLALELGWVATFHKPPSMGTSFGSEADHLAFNGFTGDAKIFLGERGQLLESYVQGGIGLYFLDSTYFGDQSVGTGFQAGGGLDLHLGPHISFGLRALYRGVAMGPPSSGDQDTFVSAVGLEGNLTLLF